MREDKLYQALAETELQEDNAVDIFDATLNSSEIKISRNKRGELEDSHEIPRKKSQNLFNKK